MTMTWIDCRGWSLIADAAVFTGKLPGLSACLSFVHALSLAVGFSLVSVMSALWGVPDEFGEVRWLLVGSVVWESRL